MDLGVLPAARGRAWPAAARPSCTRPASAGPDQVAGRGRPDARQRMEAAVACGGAAWAYMLVTGVTEVSQVVSSLP